MTDITLTPLTEEDREQFIRDNQLAFKYGALDLKARAEISVYHYRIYS